MKKNDSEKRRTPGIKRAPKKEMLLFTDFTYFVVFSWPSLFFVSNCKILLFSSILMPFSSGNSYRAKVFIIPTTMTMAPTIMIPFPHIISDGISEFPTAALYI